MTWEEFIQTVDNINNEFKMLIIKHVLLQENSQVLQSIERSMQVAFLLDLADKFKNEAIKLDNE